MLIYILLLSLLIVSSFFSSLETALLALGEVRVRNWSTSFMPQLKEWIDKPSNIITSLLLGNNLINISFSSLFTIVIYNADKIPTHFVESVSVVLSSVLLLTLGEILPKNIAHSYPDYVVRASYKPFMKFYLVAGPVSEWLNKVSFSLVGGLGKMRERGISRKEVSVALEDLQKRNMIDNEYTNMMIKTLSLSNKTVVDVMSPLECIYAVNLDWKYEKIMNELISSPFSRIPAYSGKLDNVKGIIYLKDIIGELNRNEKIEFKDILRSPVVTQPEKNSYTLFQELRKKRIHLALVKSESHLLGLVSIEDIIEEVLGEIYDEYDN
ncbi:MAG: DUF21 domain-containing protein [Elusimicrobia bacterium]|nr:DUF21 domain-containing protein [Elusimicrobiota bacterium]